MIDVVDQVPFGADHALSAREIWRRLDRDSEMSVQHALNNLAEAGAIVRRRQDTHGIAFMWIYHREASA